MHKELRIEAGTISDFGELNFYLGDVKEAGFGRTNSKIEAGGRAYITAQRNGSTSTIDIYDLSYMKYAKWASIGIALNITALNDAELTDTFKFGIIYTLKDGTRWSLKTTEIKIEDFYNVGDKILQLSGGWVKNVDWSEVEYINYIFIENTTAKDIYLTYGWSRFFLFLYGEYHEPITMSDYKYGYNSYGKNPKDIVIIGDKLEDVTNENLSYESFTLTESLCSQENIKFGLCEASYCDFTVKDRNDNFKNKTVRPYIKAGDGEEIPLGTFYVDSVTTEHVHDMITKHITAYDGLKVLEANAYNWYTSYMFALNTDEGAESRYGIEYPRQIYSTYYNIAKKLGLENPDKEAIEKRYTLTRDRITPGIPMKQINYTIDSYTTMSIEYYGLIVNDADPQKLYSAHNTNILTDAAIRSKLYYYKRYIDEYGRGLVGSGNILVSEYITDKGWKNDYLVDAGDLFQISPNCERFIVYFPGFLFDGGPNSNYDIEFFDKAEVQRHEKPATLVNGWIRLFYYSFIADHESPANFVHTIYNVDTSTTARDIIRSLLEVCGCFFKLDRYGKPAFIYCSKSGLYPRNDLYPSDSLYPRSGVPLIETMGQYTSFEAEEYQVIDYGRIQIVKRTEGNTPRSVVQWEYKGSDSKNTYKIIGNVFYSNSELEYEYDSMPEISEMLENMWRQISNLGFVPHTTKALGLPYIETGDRIGLLTKTGGIESFVFRRTLTGIQNLHDTYEATGDEYTNAVSEYSYKEWEA